MRYLYRSYCLKEGAFGRGILRSWMEGKQQRTEKVYRRKEGRGWGVETDVTTQHLKGWSEKAVFLDTKLGLRVHESLYHWGIYTHWVKSTTRQVCGRGGGGCGTCGAGRVLGSGCSIFSELPAGNPLPPPAWARATERWVSLGWPAYLTSDGSRCLSCSSPQTLCRLHRSCQSCHSPGQ